MNNAVFYRRHAMPPRQTPVDTPPSEVSKLAVHGDPSQTARQQDPQRYQNSIRWVRPSELPTMVANRYVRRGVDANSAAVRRARNLPSRAIARTRIARSQLERNATQHHEGGIAR